MSEKPNYLPASQPGLPTPLVQYIRTRHVLCIRTYIRFFFTSLRARMAARPPARTLSFLFLRLPLRCEKSLTSSYIHTTYITACCRCRYVGITSINTLLFDRWCNATRPSQPGLVTKLIGILVKMKIFVSPLPRINNSSRPAGTLFLAPDFRKHPNPVSSISI